MTFCRDEAAGRHADGHHERLGESRAIEAGNEFNLLGIPTVNSFDGAMPLPYLKVTSAII